MSEYTQALIDRSIEAEQAWRASVERRPTQVWGGEFRSWENETLALYRAHQEAEAAYREHLGTSAKASEGIPQPEK